MTTGKKTHKQVTIALIGAPNVGKTALINSLAGSRLKVGNWAGVTVEKKEATVTYEGSTFHVVDLPGVYSLNPYTEEEKVTNSFLLDTPPDIIVNVVDATNLERNLVLTTQLLDMGIPMIVALNFWSAFQDQGNILKLPRLEELLRCSIVPLEATKKKSVEKLLHTIATTHSQNLPPSCLPLEDHVEKPLESIQMAISRRGGGTSANLRFRALQCLQQNNRELLQSLDQKTQEHIQTQVNGLEHLYQQEVQTLLAEQRYGVVQAILHQTYTKPSALKKSVTETLDVVALHPTFGIPVFLLLLYAVFKITFDGSGAFIDWVDGFANDFVGGQLFALLAFFQVPEWLVSFFLDGVIGGVGTVLTFLPLMVILYFFLAVLEESGYMARAAFVMDRLLRPFGLNGRAFIPLLVGFGCNVPAVYATRTLSSRRDKLIIGFLLSFMSCGAKLPIYALFTAIFFAQHQALVVLALYVLGIGTAVAWALIAKSRFSVAEDEFFFIELPPYRFPTLQMLWSSIWHRTSEYVQKAGTMITVVVIMIWALINLPYGVPPEQSVLGTVSRTITPIFRPLGFGTSWQATASIVPGFLAKEAVIGALGAAYGGILEDVADGAGGEESGSEVAEERDAFFVALGKQFVAFGEACVVSVQDVTASFIPGTFALDHEEDSFLFQRIRRDFSPSSALAFMVFNLLLVSCVPVMGALRQEFGTRYLVTVLGLTTCTAYLIALIVYQLSSLFF